MSGGHSSQIDLELGGASLLAVKFKVKTESELDHFLVRAGQQSLNCFGSNVNVRNQKIVQNLDSDRLETCERKYYQTSERFS